MTENAKKSEIESISFSDSTPTSANSGCSSEANAGSPIQPSPSDASVMPSWHAER